MDFFKSVFSEPIPTSTPSPSPPTSSIPEAAAAPPTSSWGFGSTLLRTIASKSESLIDDYYKDLQEFSSGLKKETSVIRQAASRAVLELPARLESSAAIAQESLEAVGQAIDTVGSTVSDIIGKDLNFASNDGFMSTRLDESENSTRISDKDLNLSGNAKPYSRIEAMIRALQCSIRTYCDEVEEIDYNDWKLGFRIEDKRDEIERLIEENGVIKEIYNEVVPMKVDEETFWCRYFYRVEKVIKAEEVRSRIVKRAISGEDEEDLSWDVDDDDDDDDDDHEGIDVVKLKDELKVDINKKGKGIEESRIEREENEGGRDNEGAGMSGIKSDILVEKDSLGERMIDSEKEASERKIGSDVSIISSQRSSHAEEDLGWDEIEDIRSGDEINIGDQGSSPNQNTVIDLRKRLSSSEEDEDLTWHIEDDDEPVKL